MLVNDKAAIARLNSPDNLINQLRSNGSRKSAMGLFGIGKDAEKPSEKKVIVKFNPFTSAAPQEIQKQETSILIPLPSSTPEEPSINSLLENSDQQIKLATAHDSALEVLTRSVLMMKDKLDDIKPDKLPSVITATSKVVESIRRERAEANKNSSGKEVHYHFYTPNQRKVTEYEVIDVG